MSRFKTAAIAPTFSGGIVFKRKGNRVRYIDPATAKVSGWMRVAPTVVRRGVLTPEFTAESLTTTTVATLRDMAKARGIKVPSKARKADIIAALTDA
jgi:hypothetical protein